MVYDTDKLSGGLLEEYESIFQSIRNEPIKILEIGLLRGGSMLWTRDFFPNAKIYGVDIVLPDIKDERITLIKADQRDTEKLEEISAMGPFDIVIDDGCHLPYETNNTFDVFWKTSKHYIIEDWDACFRNPSKYMGMDNVIMSIVGRKQELGIKDIVISIKKKSYAYFNKN